MTQRILFVDQFGYFGGAQRVLLDLIQELSKDGDEAWVALNGEGEFRDALVNAGIPVRSLPLGDYSSGGKSVLETIRFFISTLHCIWLIFRYVRNQKSDLIYANGPRTFIGAVLAGRLTRRPVLWHLHNILPTGAILRLLCCFGKWTQGIIACSKAAAIPWIQCNPRLKLKIQVIYNDVPSWLKASPILTAKLEKRMPLPIQFLVFGILGRITPVKGQKIFLKAALLILKEFPDTQFMIIGSPAPRNKVDHEYWEELIHAVHESQLTNHIHFIEHTKNLMEVYTLLDVVVVASLVAEAFPLTILEAMTLQKSIIAPSSGGIPEMLKNDFSGILIEKITPETLAAAMKTLICNPTQRSAIALAAQEEALLRFSQKRFLDEINKVLKICH
jgi:glycosyltransferase involved in cell wall biosynthesis